MWEKGQKVICHYGYGQKAVATIDRVTPSGIAVIGDEKFNQRGTRIPAERYNRVFIAEATDEEIEEIRIAEFIKKTVYTFNTIGWGTLIKDYETAKKAREFLKGLNE